MKTISLVLILTFFSGFCLGCASSSTTKRGEPIRVGVSKTRVLELPLESYIAGVLGEEMSESWPLEALKAQAVATRTYALYRKANPRSTHFHLAADTSDQVFQKKKKYAPAVLQAVAETEGQVLTYQDAPFEAFFHSCCGGKSEAATHVWTEIETSPLLNVRADPYCRECPAASWKLILSKEEVKEALASQGYPLKGKWRIQTLRPNNAGRVSEVVIKSAKETYLIPGQDFRRIVGYQKIKSTRFRVSQEEDDLLFEGEGSGHGVGLCQWGAKEMADEGFSYEKILEFYYPGASLQSASTAKEAPTLPPPPPTDGVEAVIQSLH